MKALIMDEERHLIVKDMPKPQEKDENIIIKVEAASICGTDMRTFLKGNAKIDPPRILGHECAGTIIHAGSLAKEHGYPDELTDGQAQQTSGEDFSGDWGERHDEELGAAGQSQQTSGEPDSVVPEEAQYTDLPLDAEGYPVE